VSRPRERGIALVAATAALAVLSVLATSLARTSAGEQRLARHGLAVLQAEALARSGIAAAAVWLGERPDAPDVLGAPWASGRRPLGPGWVEVQVEDEARRIDLNLQGDVLPRLLAELGLDARLADTIGDWTDRDSMPRRGGAEREHYLGLRPPYLPADGPLGSVGELAHVRGVHRAVLARLRPFVTAAGEPAVNPNTAPREVLAAVLGDPALVERVLAARRRGPLDDARLEGLVPGGLRPRFTARGRHYAVRARATVGELHRTAEAIVEATPGLEPVVRGWRLHGG
jgi:type II secretory pathway component PulK